MADRKPNAVIWNYPSQGRFVSHLPRDIPAEGNPAPLVAGTAIRSSCMLGVVLEDREYEGIPIAARSVAVRCTYSLGRFPDLDTGSHHVWSTKVSQVLTGGLLAEAERDPEPFLRKFMALEAEINERERRAALAKYVKLPEKSKKRPPGKQHRRSK